MLFNPKKILKSGDEIDLSLILENGKKLDIKAHVRKHSEMHGMEYRY
jgi:copper(I)-binding protein